MIAELREAEDILCHLLDCQRIDLYTKNIAFDQFKRRSLYELMELRAQGEPLQYILGETEFYGFKFKIQKGVFIPRPETEILVSIVINKLPTTNYQLPTNILELCAGSGNIAISLTKMLPHHKIFASDISKKAVSLAKENAHLNNVGGSIDFRCGDLFKPWQDKDEPFFDIIICNPPYIKRGDLNNLPLDVRNEPVKALDGGEDGLDFYKRIHKGALSYLKEKGYIFFEISPDIAESVKSILFKDFFNIEIVKDYNSLDRVLVAQKR